jgi:hypothetical protein
LVHPIEKFTWSKMMETSANRKMKSENPEDTEPDAKVLARMLEDMEFLGLIEFKASDAGAAVDLMQ